MSNGAKKVVALFLAAMFVCVFATPIVPHVVTAEEYNAGEKVYCTATMNDDFTDNEVLIVVTPDNNSTEYSVDDFSDVGCVSLTELSIGTSEDSLSRIIKLTLSTNSKQNVLNAIHQLELRNHIYSAEPNYLIALCKTPNDPEYHIYSQWAIDKIGLPDAWDVTTGSSTVRVGVIDTGIDASHPDLANRVNQTLSRCFTTAFNTGTEDIHGHGTMVAGIIGAQGNNSIGMVGTCWNVELVSLRVATSGGSIGLSAAVQAIEYADSINIPILNFSCGSDEDMAVLQSMKVAIQNYEGLFVCSAGNTSKNTDLNNHYPSGYDLDNIISVGSSTSTDTLAGHSNFGQTTVDIFAPGSDIVSCYPINRCTTPLCDSPETHHTIGYHINGGTSLAAPFVAGVAALILAVKPNMTPVDIKDQILSNVDIVYDSNGNNVFGSLCVSGGRLNAGKALHFHQYTFTPKNATSHIRSCS